MSLSEEMSKQFGPETLNRPMPRSEAYGCFDLLVATIKELRDRVDELEAGGVKYLGSYQRAAPYQRGSVVTYDGCMWTALSDLRAGVVPGKAPEAWQLSAKAGKGASR